jgi:hypothetical protein
MIPISMDRRKRAKIMLGLLEIALALAIIVTIFFILRGR